MGEASDIEWLWDHLDRLFGDHPFSPPGVRTQWSRWLAKNNAGSVGWGLQPTGKERWLPSGQRKAEELRLTLFGLAMVGTAVELLAWAEWLAEKHKDTPDEKRVAALHEDCSRLFAQSTEREAAKAAVKGKALDIEILRQRDSARKELGAARQEIAQLRALLDQRNQTILNLEYEVGRRCERNFELSEKLRSRHGGSYPDASAAYEDGFERALGFCAEMTPEHLSLAAQDPAGYFGQVRSNMARVFNDLREREKRERELKVAAAQAVDPRPDAPGIVDAFIGALGKQGSVTVACDMLKFTSPTMLEGLEAALREVKP